MALLRLHKDGPYRVARGSADIRGWRVYDRAGEKLGEIAGLLFEPAALKVRFAIVELWDRQVAVPVADLDLDTDAQVVLAPGYDLPRLLALPRYSDEAIASYVAREADDGPHGHARRAHPFDLLYGLTDEEDPDADLDQPILGHASGVAPTAPIDIRRSRREPEPVTFMASEPTPAERHRMRRAGERRPYLPGAPRIEAE